MTPALFGRDGVWGGGERYAFELARAQAELVPTRLIAFGSEGASTQVGALTVRTLKLRGRLWGDAFNPLSEALIPEILRADVVHVHQFATALTDLVAAAARLARRRVFVTDHGVAARTLLSDRHRARIVDGHLAVSAFAAEQTPVLRTRSAVIYGGVDAQRFTPGPRERDSLVVFVGRLMPHKGVDVLIRALPDGAKLRIYGRSYHDRYLAHLKELAEPKQVEFVHSASDAEIVSAYQSARVSVLPSVHWTLYGDHARKTELFGLALVEAMACATPVICSRAGAMPEVVQDGRSGFVVAPGDADALRERLELLLGDDVRWREMSAAAVEHVHDRFTWAHVAQRALAAYGVRGA